MTRARPVALTESALWREFALPVRDALRAMDGVTDRLGERAFFWIMLGMAVSWWVYVPLHELFHAWGCQIAGGTVTKLEINEVYGATWLSQLFPYITPGSEYAGRLSGFDTGGSDTVYLCTVFFPYLLTLLIGVPALYAATRRASAILFGAAVPWAYTPFLSITGDYYEMGSILVSRWTAPWVPQAPERWRADDFYLLAKTLFGPAGAGNSVDAVGLGAGLLLGTLAAFLTYTAGAWLAIRLNKVSNDRTMGA